MEAIISIITELLRAGIPLAAKQVQLIRGAPERVQSLQDELQFIEKSLNEYDGAFMKDNKVNEWLTQIYGLALEAKDTIDTFKTEKHTQNQRNPVARLLYAWPHGTKLRKIALKVDMIKKKIEEIDGYRKKYCVDGQVVAKPKRNSEWLEKQRREVEEENVVGFGVAVEQMTNMLLTKALKRDVVSIVGTTGSGKTTLAKRIYGSIGNQFQHHAWVFVPSRYKMKDLLLAILSELIPIEEETSKLDDVKLGEKLRNFLQGKRYLIVMDGVEETQLWETLEKNNVFPNEKHGSRLLLTTRSKNVASLASSSSSRIHNIQPLDDEAKWELLEKLVFKDEKCPQGLVKLGKQIATKCAGLPLAIVSLSSLLARNKAYGNWLQIISNVTWYLNPQDSPPSFGILDLTYDTTIPEHLKKCLLYLGVFPSGFEIHARQIINLWVAEGLVEDTRRSKAEEIGRRYLEELISLSLIEVIRKRSDGSVRTFQIHEIWRMFCVFKSESIGFLQVHTKFGSHPFINGPWSWRLSIHYDLRYILSNRDYLPHLCSLLCFHNEDSLDSNRLTLQCKHFSRLKVLDLGSTRVSKVHGGGKSLSLLKYLKLNNPNLSSLPRFLFSLPNLMTLDIKNTCVILPCLPSGIWKMQNLRHLLLPPHTTLPKCPDHQTRLWHLQTLSTITPNENTAALIFGSKFPSLIKLTLNSQNMEQTKRCLEWLYKLDCLQKLKIINPTKFPTARTSFPASLVKVSLVKTDLVADDVMKMLECLDHLQVLKLLKKSIRGPKLEMTPNSFPQLRFLFMEEILVKTWRMGDEAMGSLEDLTITRCHELESLPKQLWQLHNIRQVKVNSPSQCLRRELEQPSVQRCEVQIHF
ncbi:hypothetical protein ERO13_A05G006200v2 [Gossypium hirsutum]|uniref:Disease resistance protein RPP13 n=1 Tax=Gossypium hirsutum TaxID=3635 RepID=A0A1U8PFL4_GOSHI|nr:disease resistance protein RPP13 [Gossypium hirsutum]KAG4197166.1 hypothetical protein ERO13_A05G006200v2 [Gossypium hirsutum]